MNLVVIVLSVAIDRFKQVSFDFDKLESAYKQQKNYVPLFYISSKKLSSSAIYHIEKTYLYPILIIKSTIKICICTSKF